jgi:hypothetical protein
MWKPPHVISSHEGHAKKLHHKGTTLDLNNLMSGKKNGYVLQYGFLLEIEFFGKTYIIAWLLMTTANDQSIHSESSILQVSSVLNIHLKHGYACHNDGKDGDKNNDPPCHQLDYNVGILHSDDDLEEVKVNLLDVILHFGTGLVWNNQEYER